jgi:hypothetical protein
MKGRLVLVMATSICVACSASPSINVGNEADGSVAGTGGASGFGGVGGFGGDDNALIAHIENPQAMTIEIVTISCAGDCADVIAVASGGNPGYTFAWNDGVTTATREVCPANTTTFTVTVTDTAIDDPEFHYDAQTVSAAVTAEVLECAPDAGMPDATVPDAGLCIENPSFEGPAEISVAPPSWTTCLSSPDTNPSLATLPASEGATYLGLAGFSQLLLNLESASGALCSPLVPEQEITFSVDLAMLADSLFPSTTPTVLEVWGGMTSCGKDELLWTSPAITRDDAWTTHCATLRPSQAYPFLLLIPSATSTAFVLVDNFTSGAACPGAL